MSKVFAGFGALPVSTAFQISGFGPVGPFGPDGGYLVRGVQSPVNGSVEIHGVTAFAESITNPANHFSQVGGYWLTILRAGSVQPGKLIESWSDAYPRSPLSGASGGNVEVLYSTEVRVGQTFAQRFDDYEITASRNGVLYVAVGEAVDDAHVALTILPVLAVSGLYRYTDDTLNIKLR